MNIPNIKKGRIEIKRRTKFTKEEDEKLMEVVEEVVNIEGRKNWTKISEEMGSRTAKECKDRWENYLTSEIPISANSSNEIKRAMIEIMNMENLNEICTDKENEESEIEKCTDKENEENKVEICTDKEGNENFAIIENDIFFDSISKDNLSLSIDFI
ncbi:hypothetical protein M9Y10_008657 [Tritrichomonas musculus]|uniref:Myb-like DNA-binding domain containing protein n=1 Tax=Tritrichomonas musculus TaxID=1915356 RepID=A0ABR2IYS2_9EUKA